MSNSPEAPDQSRQHDAFTGLGILLVLSLLPEVKEKLEPILRELENRKKTSDGKKEKPM